MTLVQSIGMKSFTIMTTDFRVVRTDIEQDIETGIYSTLDGTARIEQGLTHHKIDFLTDYVMMGFAGYVELAEHIRVELIRRVSPNDGLAECKSKLSDIITEIKSNKESDLYNWIRTPDGVGVVLNGFYKNGVSGQVMYNLSGGISELAIPIGYPDAFFTGMLPPTSALGNKKILEDYVQEQGEVGFDYLLKATCFVHGLISYFHDILVSPEMEYYCLINDGGIIKKATGEYDTSDFFPVIEKQSENVKELVT